MSLKTQAKSNKIHTSLLPPTGLGRDASTLLKRSPKPEADTGKGLSNLLCDGFRRGSCHRACGGFCGEDVNEGRKRGDEQDQIFWKEVEIDQDIASKVESVGIAVPDSHQVQSEVAFRDSHRVQFEEICGVDIEGGIRFGEVASIDLTQTTLRTNDNNNTPTPRTKPTQRGRSPTMRPRRSHSPQTHTSRKTFGHDHDSDDDDDDARPDVALKCALMCDPPLKLSGGGPQGFVLPKSNCFGAAGIGVGGVPHEVVGSMLVSTAVASPSSTSQSRIPSRDVGQGATAESQFGSVVPAIGRLLENDSLLGKVPAKESSCTPGTTRSLQGENGTTRGLEGTTTTLAATAARPPKKKRASAKRKAFFNIGERDGTLVSSETLGTAAIRDENIASQICREIGI